jgi:ketosteroid isomerase-like protein
MLRQRFVIPLVLLAIFLVGGAQVADRSVARAVRPAYLAQEATPAASPVALPGFLQRLHDGIVSGNGEAVAALYAEDGIYEDVPTGAVAQGREEIAAFIAGEAAKQADVVFQPTTVYEGDGWAVWEYVFAATDPKSGVRLEARGATVFEMEGELIRHSTDYYVADTAD